MVEQCLIITVDSYKKRLVSVSIRSFLLGVDISGLMLKLIYGGYSPDHLLQKRLLFFV